MNRLDPLGPPERISPHCDRIPVPDPFVPGVTSVFVLRSDDRGPSWLLDAGADLQESESALRAGLGATAESPESVGGVALSHTHLDHAGGLLRWRPERLLAHANAVSEMRNRKPVSSRGRKALRRMGVPDGMAQALAPDSEPVGGTPLADVPVSDPVTGASGPLAVCAGWNWLLAEGHAPGHLMLHHPADGLLLSADHFLVRWKTPLRISDPDEDSFGRYARSLDGAIALEPEVVCSSHTPAVRPAVPFLEDKRAALSGQLERTRNAVSEGAVTAWNVVTAGGRSPSGGLLVLLLRERMAMLRHLVASGEAAREVEDGVERFALA